MGGLQGNFVLTRTIRKPCVMLKSYLSFIIGTEHSHTILQPSCFLPSSTHQGTDLSPYICDTQLYGTDPSRTICGTNLHSTDTDPRDDICGTQLYDTVSQTPAIPFIVPNCKAQTPVIQYVAPSYMTQTRCIATYL